MRKTTLDARLGDICRGPILEGLPTTCFETWTEPWTNGYRYALVTPAPESGCYLCDTGSLTYSALCRFPGTTDSSFARFVNVWMRDLRERHLLRGYAMHGWMDV